MDDSVLLFVTAPLADHKLINRFLLHLGDQQRNGIDKVAHLVTARNAYALGDPPPQHNRMPEPTDVPVKADLSNAWTGASISDVEGWVRDVNHEDPPSMFLLLDDEGVQNRTVVFAEQRFDDETDELTKDYNKCRVPWADVYSMWCNLDIGNMGWEDFTDEDRGGDAEGWWIFGEDNADILTDKEKEKLREKIAKLEEQGLA
ncbi:uncharacterized protein LTR77_001098 [Saxophila tyrrhenica]|uniref:DUF6924 domain-containing protein n=1 Tax=Saxophila tyrrhenica TaxID=1690608 RepID=A0AAV9PJ66_9PEZI|nr:hypothetical protein LTR77_001098 [Saxophila tyrrhenica]